MMECLGQIYEERSEIAPSLTKKLANCWLHLMILNQIKYLSDSHLAHMSCIDLRTGSRGLFFLMILGVNSSLLGCVDTVVLDENADEKLNGNEGGAEPFIPGVTAEPLPSSTTNPNSTNVGGANGGSSAETDTNPPPNPTPPVMETEPTSCTPGERLGTCQECAPNNTVRLPREDEECAPIEFS